MEAGVEVLCGMKLCCFADIFFKGALKSRGLVSSRSRSKLPVDRTPFRDGGLMAEEGDRRLLSLEKPGTENT